MYAFNVVLAIGENKTVFSVFGAVFGHMYLHFVPKYFKQAQKTRAFMLEIGAILQDDGQSAGDILTEEPVQLFIRG